MTSKFPYSFLFSSFSTKFSLSNMNASLSLARTLTKVFRRFIIQCKFCIFLVIQSGNALTVRSDIDVIAGSGFSGQSLAEISNFDLQIASTTHNFNSLFSVITFFQFSFLLFCVLLVWFVCFDVFFVNVQIFFKGLINVFHVADDCL